ncbi:MAG: response regulator, partial [Deltaproteobacteria bacterium]|nr:response regulator [Deltaproteobacteria bacterium]
KKVLIVDDEPDVLEELGELLSMCEVAKASTFEEAKKMLETRPFDIAILDIMGVDGYKLLEIANQKKVIAVMLTAHALSPENIVKSFKGGAASYLPKEKMGDIVLFLNEIFWWRWLERWASFYDEKFGPGWQDKDKDFWEKFNYYL